jgi:hypothetical protein
MISRLGLLNLSNRLCEYMFNDLPRILMISRSGMVLVVIHFGMFLFNDLSQILMISRVGVVTTVALRTLRRVRVRVIIQFRICEYMSNVLGAVIDINYYFTLSPHSTLSQDHGHPNLNL